jgi:D-alanyl-D-alanine carboxypeptidase
MKKLLFLSVLLGLGFTTIAQINDPDKQVPFVNFNKKQQLPLESGNSKKSDPLYSRHEIPANGNNVKAPSSFDPTWGNRFQTVLDSVVIATNMEGAALAVLVPGQGLWTGVSGVSRPGVQITKAMRFGIGSNTKLFIAVTLTKLQEMSILSLDDHLYQWLPTYPHVDSTTTIRQLLSHQSGIFDYLNDRPAMWTDSLWADTSRFWTAEEVLATIGDPHFPPGHGYRYSNTNYLLAGMVIEAATGISWVQKLHDIILNPLTMDSTFAGAFESRNGPVADEWDAFNSNIDITNSPMTAEYSQANACGALLSTAQEMAEWYSALFGGAILSSSSLQQITNFESTSWYGLGLFHTLYKNHLNYQHTGGMLGYASLVWYDVETQAVLCMLMNDRNYDFNSRVIPLIDVLYDDCPKKQHDAGITKIVSPWENICNATVTPSVMLTNFGSAPLTSVNIIYKLDQGIPFTFNWTGTLNTGDLINVILPAITGGDGFHTFTCYTSLPDGVQEGNTYNDTAKSNFIINIQPSMIASLYESFDDSVFPPAGWTESTSSMLAWGQTSLAGFSGTGSAARSNYNDGLIGAYYDLDLPLFHFGGGTHPILEFEYAYVRYPNRYGDSLQVFISNDCGTTWQTLFNKGGLELCTYGQNYYPFYPQSGAAWKQEIIPMDAYTGDALIRFRDVCGFSNNLFLDDVTVTYPEGIAENKPSDSFTVFPNPASDDISVSGLPVNSEIQLSDLTGKLLMTQKMMNTSTKLDIHQLHEGVYILKSTLGVKKIVKM